MNSISQTNYNKKATLNYIKYLTESHIQETMIQKISSF